MSAVLGSDGQAHRVGSSDALHGDCAPGPSSAAARLGLGYRCGHFLRIFRFICLGPPTLGTRRWAAPNNSAYLEPERRSFNHGIQVSIDNRVLLNLKTGQKKGGQVEFVNILRDYIGNL